MLIFLIGFMGSGKTRVGKKLAHKLDKPFYDLDVVIESKTGKSVSEIFTKLGEVTFREFERQCLLDMLEMDDAIIACGGGTPCYFDNMQLMNNKGITVYLKTSAWILASRLEVDKSPRPMLGNFNPAEEKFEEFIEKLLLKREYYYMQSRLIVKGRDINHTSIAEMIEGLGK